MTNIVYIATSLDGYISAPGGSLDWLSMVPNPDDDDLGFAAFMSRVDVVVMGRVTFESVVGFDVGWPCAVPGLILSTSLAQVPAGFEEKVQIISGTPEQIIEQANGMGYKNLYIDGGKTIQGFLKADKIDEMILSELPVLLGGGEQLFGDLEAPLEFEHVGVEVLLGQITKRHYVRKREQ
jgi:dihydrofolate reductase